MMKKLFNIIIIIAFLISSLPFSRPAEAGDTLFTPCQYKNTYKYYISRGEEYLADNQLESALESFEKALIVQPNSEEARLNISKIRQMLRQRITPAIARAREEAMEQAILTAVDKIRQRAKEEKRAIPTKKAKVIYHPKRRTATAKAPARPEVAITPPQPYQKPSPGLKKEAKAPKTELAQAQPPSAAKERKFDLPKDFNQVYDEYISPQKFSDGLNNKLQQAAESINNGIAPNRAKGEYRLALGFAGDDIIAKDANADYHNMPGDTSWRYIFGNDRHNSYDKKVYSRLKVELDSPMTKTLSSYNEIVIDPWTFVGKKRVYVTGSNGDNVQMDLKYWSNAKRTINETYRTERGDIVNIQESKVHDGKTSAETYQGLSDWGTNRFSVPEADIDRMYVPLRRSWVEYNNEPYHARLFFMSDQDEALTSDDPMRLSNNKVWWEESPWLDEYNPSRTFERTSISAPIDFSRTKEPVRKGQWIRRQSYIARDSQDQRLTFLRGLSLDAEFENGTSVDIVTAAPRNLWDEYEQATSLASAIRLKSPVSEKLTLGSLYTLKTGFRHQSVEAVNNLFAIDSHYNLFANTGLLAEGAISNIGVDESIGYNNDYTGYAAMLGLNNKGPLSIIGRPDDRYELETSFTHMNEEFFPGLSNYRFTRKEFEFAKHIHFDKLNPKNEAVKVGDGIDVGRNSFKIKARAESPDNNLDTRFDFRNVHSEGGEFIENVYRTEAEYNPLPKLTLKGLAYYQHLPETTLHIDPLINAKNSYSAFTDYFTYEDVWLENTIIDAGLDPSIGAFGLGAEYDFCDYFSANGIIEVTNDPKDWPRGLLNNVYVTDEYKDGVIWDKITPFLYEQSVFGIPPYTYYGIYKSGFTYYPFGPPVKINLNYVYNENKYAMAVDDNSTHQGIEIEYRPNNRLTMGFLYQYTRQNDLYNQFVLKDGGEYAGHHNIFASLDYVINQDQHLSLIFGEYVGYPYPYPEEHYALSALNTQHIVRVVYSGSWGEPKSPLLGGEGQGEGAKFWNPLGPLNPPIPGAKFITNLYPGLVKYREKAAVAPAESDWDSFYTKLDFGLDAYDKEDLEGSLRFGLFGSFTEEESWEREGVGEYQKNDTDLSGADINASIGWALPVPSKYISFTPLINAGYRRVEFERSNFNFLESSISEIGEVDEVFNVSFLGIGGRLDYLYAEKFNLYTNLSWAPFVYTPTRNETSGRLSCNKGVIYHTEGGCDYALSDKLDISLGGFWDLQHLDRTERIDNGVVSAELPDNKLETFGLKLGGSYKF